MCSISFDPVEDASADRADCIVGVWPDIQIIDLAPLVGETDDQCDMFPTESSAEKSGGEKVLVQPD